MRKNPLISLLLLISIVLTGCGYTIENPLNLTINDFTYTNQDNQQVSLDDLEGKVWIADFIFSNCSTVCLPMMSNMAMLQEKFKAEGIAVEFVSFSVDPQNDSPEVLKEYAAEYDVDFSNWTFITGYQQEEIEQFAIDSFNTYAKKPANDSQVIHGLSFFLVDQNGVVKQEYSGLDVPVDAIMKDVKYLLAKES